MRKKIILLAFSLSGIWASDALAYLKEGVSSGLNKPNGNSANIEKGAACAPASQRYIMRFNDVSALIENGGSMFQDRQKGVAAYEVPKGSNRFAIYSGSLWMGGIDANNQLKLAALTFRNGNDFWPGPLGTLSTKGNYNGNEVAGVDVVRDYGEATIESETCLAYDKFDSISKAIVNKFNIWWECDPAKMSYFGRTQQECDPVLSEGLTGTELNQIKNWPAHGDAAKGEDHFLAPFYDRDNSNTPGIMTGRNGVYNPMEEGDFPWYNDLLKNDDPNKIICGKDRRVSLYGDATLWWVFNDKGNIHTETSGDPIGMEIRAQAFSFATTDEINRMTFFNYELINRGTQTLYNTYFSQFLDPDVGNYNDDYIGCDVSRGLGFAYNADPDDEDNAGKFGYGENPPAIGVDFFEGPYMDPDTSDNKLYNLASVDNPDGTISSEYPYIHYSSDPVGKAIDSNGIVYGGIGLGYSDNIIDNERYGMRRFSYFTGQGASFPYTDPSQASQYYLFMQGKWANGDDMRWDGVAGKTSNGPVCSYMFPGDSDPLYWSVGGSGNLPSVNATNWTELTGSNDKGDRRFVQSAGPFTLKPGAFNNITVGIVYGRGTDGDPYSSVLAMKRADTKAQALFDACFKIMNPPMAPQLTIQEMENELILYIDNPSSSNNFKEKYKELDDINIPQTLADGTVLTNDERSYVFEGYQIYQLKNEAVSSADINDSEKAKLVAQCDVKNNVTRLINFEYDEGLSLDVPKLKVEGQNKGIKHSFKITEDAFATGQKRLVNHKTYYFVAIAYGYNQYRKFDPNDPLLLDGQKKPYVASRLSYNGGAIKPVIAIPHNVSPEADGTSYGANYGDTPLIRKMDGFGNGNNALELDQASTDSILNFGSVKMPVYKQNAGPINVKVIDPLNVVDGYFELKFNNYTNTSVGWDNATDTASWTIYRYSSEGGSLLDSISSEQTVEYLNEQLIPEWGISVEIYQNRYTGAGNNGNVFTEPISSSIEFADSSKRWLSGISDDASYFPTNWIRSGSYDPKAEEDNPSLTWTNPTCYKDEVSIDPDKKYSKLLGGTIAPHRLTGYQCNFMPLAYYKTNTTPDGIMVNHSSRTSVHISLLPSVDIVLTNDKSKWTRCPVIELCRDKNMSIGGAIAGGLRKSPSVDKEGKADGTGDGMGWFPGYAIDVETGTRLYMAFGENSFLSTNNGADMKWNPTDKYIDQNIPIFGGQHAIYVFGHKLKEINNISGLENMEAYNESNNEIYNLLTAIVANPTTSTTEQRKLYSSLMWVANPILEQGEKLMSTDVKIKLRVNKEYKKYSSTGINGGLPMFSWNANTMKTVTNDQSSLAEALKLINVVPNPYYAYSEYERNKIDTRVKIVNLPERCTVRIYGINGKLIRTFKKDSPITSLDWDLNNQIGVAISSGVYLIHVEVPDLPAGENVRILKFMVGQRQVDLHGI